ncbi:hypothetical protein N7478_006490 [Penicillium angulare]|uniref:uncharacterized protein n=1 Tax=Penicillium angulare TaxID=116970 RepID=UPI00253F7906|nr:uncharacterized protein N7478_006490 [Penicillium angulare]KAJ5281118.1 hypothetical protein N7478_006490 [Penicillium angulare]
MSVASPGYLDAMAPPGGQSYRKPAELPFELTQNIGIFFEENLLPLPQHIALATTFLVHPSTTTRAKSAEEKDAAHLSLRLLRLLSSLVSPQDCKLNHAFSFADRVSRSGRQKEEGNSSLRSDKPLNLEMGKSDSLWSRAEDFWHMVGWAFNCSVLHPERWERWQIWLRYMCDVLEDDWAERVREYEEVTQPVENGGRQRAVPLNILRDSLIYQFITSNSTYGRNRRILRAIFADGSTASINEFRAVFKKELTSLQAPEKPKKRGRGVNIDQDIYGDYLSQDETDEEMNGTTDSAAHNTSPSNTKGKTRRTKRTRRGTRSETGAKINGSAEAQQTSLPHHSVGLAASSGLASLRFRKRLMGLLSNVSERLPRDFMSWNDLYDLFVEHIRPLSLPAFQTMISPAVLPVISEPAQATLCEKLLFNLRESSAPDSEDTCLNQAKLEHCFLPYSAASATMVSNAKVSLLLEATFTLLATSGMISFTRQLEKAVHDGVHRRGRMAQDDLERSQNTHSQEPIEWLCLIDSGLRLVYFLELFKDKTETESLA